MGDMKTPDFDDLLAAFDIPDIDAKEAIQSSPDEEEQREVGSDVDEEERSPPSCFPCPASHIDPPVVSVIVKNKVQSYVEDSPVRDQTDNPSTSGSGSHIQVKFVDLTSQLGPKIPIDAPVEPQIANGFEGSGPRDQGQGQTQRYTMKANREDSDKRPEVGSIQNTTDVVNSLNPLLYLPSSTGASNNCSTPHSISSQSSQKDKTSILSNSSPSPIPPNDHIKTGTKSIMHSDEEDSEPDFGSPLVIQESPEFLMSSPPKFKRSANARHPELLGSPETTSCLVSHSPNMSSLVPAKLDTQLAEEGRPITSRSPSVAPHPQSPQDFLPTVNRDFTSVQKEKYPEHVIDERDSPESPPPSEMGRIIPKRTSSSDSAQTFLHQEELTKSDSREDIWPGDADEVSKQLVGSEGNANEDNGDACTEDPASIPAEVSDLPQLRPLKFKIKMHSATPLTKTVSVAAPKRSVKATTKSMDTSKPSPELKTRPKRALSQQTKTTATLPDENCALKDKTTLETKTNVSPTAVNITKTTALPSVSFPRVSSSGISPQNLGSKNLDGGVTLPSPLLHPQSSSRPASIVNSTGAIISKSQTNLVEAFNKILNNRNLLPSYKPDLSSPPAEWDLHLPAQVSCHWIHISWN